MFIAHGTLSTLADAAAANLLPEGRANAIAGSLNQMAEIGEALPLSQADCAAGFSVLAHSKSTDKPGPIEARRHTCSELATLSGNGTNGDPANLAAVFRAVEARFKTSEDPRQKAMAATAAREAAELEA